MKVEKFISEKTNIDLDYSNIKPVVNEMIDAKVAFDGNKKHSFSILKIATFGLIVAIISVFSTIAINHLINKDGNILERQRGTTTSYNVDKGKDPGLVTQNADSNDDTIFDQIIAFGPEASTGSFGIDVILKSNLLKEEDKETLKEYQEDTKKTSPNHEIAFQVCLGIKDGKDYVYLIDYCGYDKKLDKEVINTFLFESNLSYSFNTIVTSFEKENVIELSNAFLNSSIYDSQNKLVSGIILDFIESENGFEENYVIKYDNKLLSMNSETIEVLNSSLPEEAFAFTEEDYVFIAGTSIHYSSTIFSSSNKDLINYVLKVALSINYSEKFDELVLPKDASNDIRNVRVQLTNDRYFKIILPDTLDVYLCYYENHTLKWEYKAKKPADYYNLAQFCVMGIPQNQFWCDTPVVTKYIENEGLYEYVQDMLVQRFISAFSPLSKHYEEGVMFSGCIRQYFGRFDGYYAVIIDGCGFEYEDIKTSEIIDGVVLNYPNNNKVLLIGTSIYTLEEGYNLGIVSKDDLIKIASELDNEEVNMTLDDSILKLVTSANAYYGVPKQDGKVNDLNKGGITKIFNQYLRGIEMTNDSVRIDSLQEYLNDNSLYLLINSRPQYQFEFLSNGAILLYYSINNKIYRFASTDDNVYSDELIEAIKNYVNDPAENDYPLTFTQYVEEKMLFDNPLSSDCFYKFKSINEAQMFFTKYNLPFIASSKYYSDSGIVLFMIKEEGPHNHSLQFYLEGETLQSNYERFYYSTTGIHYYYYLVAVPLEDIDNIKGIDVNSKILMCGNE